MGGEKLRSFCVQLLGAEAAIFTEVKEAEIQFSTYTESTEAAADFSM